ncbi:hypothetical protein [Pseudomonas rhodesiae]|uniref:hypothetical protein n=1 Tax=Pseudomonas rhodesiae TaxID=76760 RepID=UPI00161746E5|nr:hypothetical protein [Pseudomonas rhodesiae]
MRHHTISWLAIHTVKLTPSHERYPPWSHYYPLMTLLRVHLVHNWFGYSDPEMDEALY